MSYDLIQSIFALSMASGRMGLVWGTKDKITEFYDMSLRSGGTWEGAYGPNPANVRRWQITGFMDTVGRNLIGEGWEIVWGPSVHVAQYNGQLEQTAANGMFVAHCRSEDLYVVAVAGTNFASTYAQKVEDYNLSHNQMVNFPINTTTPIESQFTTAQRRLQLGTGTAIGLHIHCAEMTHRGQTLIAFLSGLNPNRNARLVVAGHSLGGTLAPALLFQLLYTPAFRWNVEKLFALPTAGASSGNLEFAADWRSKFLVWTDPHAVAANGFKKLNTLHWNEYDPVPYAWDHIPTWYSYDPQYANRMYTLLGTISDPVCAEKAAENAAFADAGRRCSMTRIRDAERFSGTWPVKYWDIFGVQKQYDKPAQFNSYNEYMTAVGHSHMEQYYQRAGIDPWTIEPFARPI